MVAGTSQSGAPGRWRLGTQGWNYSAWVGPFYPRGTRASDYLRFYSRVFDSVEVDSSFYAVPAPSTIDGWTRRTEPDFTFSLKVPREVTHEGQLESESSRQVTREFLERILPLGPRLGPIVIQLPPSFRPSRRGVLEDFLAPLPRDLKFAVEFRDPDWFTSDVLATLEVLRMALVLPASPFVPLSTVLACAEQPTSSFSYVRWIGDRELTDPSFVQIDRQGELTEWARVLTPLIERGVDVYGYFNNHYAGHSPATLRAFMKLVGLPPRDPGELASQGSLF